MSGRARGRRPRVAATPSVRWRRLQRRGGRLDGAVHALLRCRSPLPFPRAASLFRCAVPVPGRPCPPLSAALRARAFLSLQRAAVDSWLRLGLNCKLELATGEGA